MLVSKHRHRAPPRLSQLRSIRQQQTEALQTERCRRAGLVSSSELASSFAPRLVGLLWVFVAGRVLWWGCGLALVLASALGSALGLALALVLASVLASVSELV